MNMGHCHLLKAKLRIVGDQRNFSVSTSCGAAAFSVDSMTDMIMGLLGCQLISVIDDRDDNPVS